MYRVDVTGVNENIWSTNALRFETFEEGEKYAVDLTGRWLGCDVARVVTEDTPERETYDPNDPSIVVSWRR